MIKFFPLCVTQRVMLNLLFVESSLEIVPKQIWNQPSVFRRSDSLSKKPGETLLDRTYHHTAMMLLKDAEKRGRPDIVHFSLLEALGAPLNREGMLRVYVHTIDDHIISICSETRLPKNYNRFIGLIEQLYKYRQVPLDGQPLLTLRKGTLKDLIDRLKPSFVVAFSRRGKHRTLETAIKILSNRSDVVVMLGAFPHGHFKEETINIADSVFSIDPEMLEAWTITSRLIYEFEKQIGLPTKRLLKMRGENRNDGTTVRKN